MLHAVPGYVLAPDMRSAKLFVTPPTGVTLKRVDVSDAAVMIATLALDGRGVAVDANASTPSPVVRHTISWAYFLSFLLALVSTRVHLLGAGGVQACIGWGHSPLLAAV